ncbi:Putative acetyltransferase EpsM [bacterium HR23]|uniref:Ferripyochelin binding protein n=1 Tax=uncultured prokaryote TaxID=198431 RepID=H5SLE2_9ZZZZ|nr:ferripyochelin binding protein [uncultured prokaryote]GBD11007.1 Putative acetyltransferase EpsM [bacterium HR23]
MIRTWNGKTPKVHPTAFISEAAYVAGDVEIGEYTSVWPGTVIRGDTAPIRIGRHTNIQDNSVVHGDTPTEIGDYVTLGHRVMCHAKKVGNYVLIGNGAVVNDGAEIGEFSIIASGAVVLENTKIPPRSFVVGIPAQVKGEVSERHMEMIRRIAEAYSRKGQSYLKSGLGDKIPT